MGGDGVEHWEYLKPDGLRFVWDDTLFRPGTDSFLLSSLPKLSACGSAIWAAAPACWGCCSCKGSRN